MTQTNDIDAKIQREAEALNVLFKDINELSLVRTKWQRLFENWEEDAIDEELASAIGHVIMSAEKLHTEMVKTWLEVKHGKSKK